MLRNLVLAGFLALGVGCEKMPQEVVKAAPVIETKGEESGKTQEDFYADFRNSGELTQNVVKDYLTSFPGGKYSTLFHQELVLNALGGVEKALVSEDYDRVLTSLREATYDLETFGLKGSELPIDLDNLGKKFGLYMSTHWPAVQKMPEIGDAVVTEDTDGKGLGKEYFTARQEVFPSGSIGKVHDIREEYAIVVFKDMKKDWTRGFSFEHFGYGVLPLQQQSFGLFKLEELKQYLPSEMERTKLQLGYQRLVAAFSVLTGKAPFLEKPEGGL